MELDNYFEILELLFNVMPYVFWKDRDGVYRGANKNQIKAFGFSDPAKFIGKTIFEIIQDKKSAQLINDTDNVVMNSGISQILEEIVMTIDGKKIYLSQKQPIFNRVGDVIGMLGFSMDITEIKTQQNALKEEKDNLQQEKYQLEINNYKNLVTQQLEFKKNVDQVVHDIRSPLTSLSILAEYCAVLPEKERNDFRNIASTISDIANNLLNKYMLDQNDSDKSDGARQPALVSVLLSQLLSEKKYQYKTTSIKFDYKVAKNSYFEFIMVSLIDIKRALSNIINNAVEATNNNTNGNVIIDLESTEKSIVITINDNGQGMRQEIIDKIMQNIAVTAEKVDGHGVGMRQAKAAIEKNDGQLTILSKVGTGTSIKLTFAKIPVPNWIITEIHIKPNDILLILDDDESIHSAWELRLKSIKQDKPQIKIQHFRIGSDLVTFVNESSNEDKQNFLLLSDYELLNQELNGLDIIKAVNLRRTILVTSHFNKQEIQNAAVMSDTKILPKQLVTEIMII